MLQKGSCVKFGKVMVVTVIRLNTSVSNKERGKTQSVSKDAKKKFDTNSCASAQLEAQFPCF